MREAWSVRIASDIAIPLAIGVPWRAALEATLLQEQHPVRFDRVSRRQAQALVRRAPGRWSVAGACAAPRQRQPRVIAVVVGNS